MNQHNFKVGDKIVFANPSPYDPRKIDPSTLRPGVIAKKQSNGVDHILVRPVDAEEKPGPTEWVWETSVFPR